jgi:hypothetical protein
MAPYVALALRTHAAGGGSATHEMRLTLAEFRVRRSLAAPACAHATTACAHCACDARAAQELAKAVRGMTRAMAAMQ